MNKQKTGLQAVSSRTLTVRICPMTRFSKRKSARTVAGDEKFSLQEAHDCAFSCSPRTTALVIILSRFRTKYNAPLHHGPGTSMLKTDRLRALADALARQNVMRLRDAAALLGVSEMTVRRDVAASPGQFTYLGGYIVSATDVPNTAGYSLEQ